MNEKTPAPVGAAVALDTPCVESTGPRNGSGYANEWHRFGPGDAESLAHRTAYRLAGGVIPDGMTIDHLCRNKVCVNVFHMEVVTRGENSRRAGGVEAAAAKRRAQTHCKRGHEFTPENTHTDGRGRRACKACRRATSSTWWRRKMEARNG
ncbi:MAG: HNH endonuclease [Spirochaetes bacterium]|nr:MAG: HNH endonuclease [Spirochaetota bacterium]